MVYVQLNLQRCRVELQAWRACKAANFYYKHCMYRRFANSLLACLRDSTGCRLIFYVNTVELVELNEEVCA